MTHSQSAIAQNQSSQSYHPEVKISQKSHLSRPEHPPKTTV